MNEIKNGDFVLVSGQEYLGEFYVDDVLADVVCLLSDSDGGEKIADITDLIKV